LIFTFRSALLEQSFEQASDLELVGLARQGVEAAFEEIVRRHSPRIFRIASQFFRRREAVEDAAQETFLKAYTQLKAYEERGSFEGWLARIATNTCINILRSAKRRPEYAITELTKEEDDWLEQRLTEVSDPRQSSVENQLLAADLAEKLLEKVSPDDRTVLTLMDGNELSVKEVAGMTGWSEANVKVRAMRARQRMRKALEKLLNRNKSTESAGKHEK
jgi:RNA polymerase sigma-70 factor, ECF subfamily